MTAARSNSGESIESNALHNENQPARSEHESPSGGSVFGSNGRLERKLRQQGKAAIATVLTIHRRAWAMYAIPDTDVSLNAVGHEPKCDYPRVVAKVQQDFDEAIGAGARDAESPVDRLTRLMDLHRRGAVTDDEYEALKRELLGDG